MKITSNVYRVKQLICYNYNHLKQVYLTFDYNIIAESQEEATGIFIKWIDKYLKKEKVKDIYYKGNITCDKINSKLYYTKDKVYYQVIDDEFTEYIVGDEGNDNEEHY